VLPVDFVIFFASLVIIAFGVTGFLSLFLPMPYVPTPKKIAEHMVALATLKGDERVVDLGAGDGAILITAKRLHPGVTATGVEISPVIWLLGKIRVALSRQKVRLLPGNAMNMNVRDADVIFLYALPKFLIKLQPKLDSELRPGTRVISHSFPFPNKVSKEVMVIPWGKRQRTLYRYEW
jgi:ubiquinone/menaquinone biosynthesis C-methylase UbiE